MENERLREKEMESMRTGDSFKSLLRRGGDRDKALGKGSEGQRDGLVCCFFRTRKT